MAEGPAPERHEPQSDGACRTEKDYGERASSPSAVTLRTGDGA